jgi:hypothetical protein
VSELIAHGKKSAISHPRSTVFTPKAPQKHRFYPQITSETPKMTLLTPQNQSKTVISAIYPLTPPSA